ncbi:MAG: UDP-N-acetylmuramate--L-alanine ligase, partial [Gemmatimonadetes bacterium]|nr:UDP-N-acetylmuramate--L-alanine ligase [Gemmatimonadota bacterium]
EGHFLGFGGAGMSALAELVLHAGGRVSGCDVSPGESAERLRALGAYLVRGHDAVHARSAQALVVTAAVAPDHPELQAARELGIPVLKRAQALGAIVNRGTVIAVAGTHGKTTTTTMIAQVLAAAGRNPTALVGGRVAEWGSGLRIGRDDLFVVEADEYDRSFFALAPHIVVLTSVEADHLDSYGDLAGVEAAFRAFLELVPPQGVIVACMDDPGVRRVTSGLAHAVSWYGTGDDAVLRARHIQAAGGHMRFAVYHDQRLLGDIHLAMPGEHNVRNALAAIAVTRALGIDFAAAPRVFAEFGGVARRFQLIGEAAGVRFIDDYAHHPTEIAATLAAARTAHPGARIVAVFQPHLYSRTRDLAPEFGHALARADLVLQPHLYSRTRDLATEFGHALARADLVFLTGIYPARERPIEGVAGELLARATRAAGAREVRYHEMLAPLEHALAAELRAGDLCIAMGAGDVDAAVRRVHHRLLRGES